MKQAMVSCPLGDDVYGDDPTVNSLERKVATILGKEAALFVPSGTMANLIAAMVHCNKRGSEMLCGDQSHVYKREGGIAHLAGVLVTALKNLPDGTFDLVELENHIRGTDIHEPVTMMVLVENTHSYCGGKVLPLAWLEKLSVVTRKQGISLHMDGARLFNASEYSREEPARIARDCDSVSVCFSKGLGAPVGSALAGTRRFIDQARRYRKMLGGGMRQAGVLAACALVALDETVPSLSADHRRAQYLAKAIQDLKLPTFTVNTEEQQTNIVHVNISDKTGITSQKIAERLSIVSQAEGKDCKTSDGLGIAVLGSTKPHPKILRFVLHRDIIDDDLRLAVKKIAFVLKEAEKNKIARDCDSVSVCFSKGLGAPVGSALAGTRRFIDQARRYRKMLGGGMRQAGVLAACALVALDETVPSLSADHRRAQYLAKAIQDLKLPTFTVNTEEQQTNIVHVNISDKTGITSQKIAERLSIVSQAEGKDCKTSDGLGIAVLGSTKPHPKILRFVLHRDIIDDDLRLAVKKIAFVLKEAEKNK